MAKSGIFPTKLAKNRLSCRRTDANNHRHFQAQLFQAQQPPLMLSPEELRAARLCAIGMGPGACDVPSEAPSAEVHRANPPAAAATGALGPALAASEHPAAVNLSGPSEASSTQDTVLSATDEDLEFRRWNLARRLCLAARSSDRPDDAAAALARLGRILRDAAANPARRKLKSGSPAFEAKLGSLGSSDVVAFLEFAGFAAATSKDGGATLVLKIGAVAACSAAAEVLSDTERDIAVAAASTPHASTVPASATPPPISNYAEAPPPPPAPREPSKSMLRFFDRQLSAHEEEPLPGAAEEPPPPALAEENTAGGVAADAALVIMAGTPVVLAGLVAKPELNGVAGLVLKSNAAAGRFHVRIDDGAGTVAQLKPENLRVTGPVQALPVPTGPNGAAKFFGSERLLGTDHRHLDLAIFDPLVESKGAKAEFDYKYWGGSEQPWRCGTTDAPVTDPGVIASEEVHKTRAEQDDHVRCPTLDDHADMLHGCALRADFVFALTDRFKLWTWKTWQVVQFLVKPATEKHGRCRFAHLPCVQPYTGKATVFLSHCWGSTWGDLVGAACSGSPMDRFIWIDVAAVRQWPGNGADLDFRRVIQRSNSIVVGSRLVPGKLSNTPADSKRDEKALKESPEYKAATKTLAFCRLWCIVEIYEAIRVGKPVIFRCCSVEVQESAQEHGTICCVHTGEAAQFQLMNMASIVCAREAECAVEADRTRELNIIGRENLAHVDRVIAGALRGSSAGLHSDGSFAIDAFLCGELRAEAFFEVLPVPPPATRKIANLAVSAACKGALPILGCILSSRARELQAEIPPQHFLHWLSQMMLLAAGHGHRAVCKYLLDKGVNVNQRGGSGHTPLRMAAKNGHVEIVRLLISRGAIVDQADDDGDTALIMAAHCNQPETVRVLLEEGKANIDYQGRMGDTALFNAVGLGAEEAAKVLLRAGANRDLVPLGVTSLVDVAMDSGYPGIAQLLFD